MCTQEDDIESPDSPLSQCLTRNGEKPGGEMRVGRLYGQGQGLVVIQLEEGRQGVARLHLGRLRGVVGVVQGGRLARLLDCGTGGRWAGAGKE